MSSEKSYDVALYTFQTGVMDITSGCLVMVKEDISTRDRYYTHRFVRSDGSLSDRYQGRCLFKILKRKE